MRVAVAVCTLDRREGLSRTLAGLMRQRLQTLGEGDVGIVVVDNSAAGLASGAVAALRSTPTPYPLTYVHEPRRGLANARNAALDAAIASGAALLAFVDDDEVPGTGWLEAMVAAMADGTAVGAVGPVYPLFVAPPETLPPDAYATLAQFADGEVAAGYTSSCIMRLSEVVRLGCRFDPAYNESGGEDTAFFAMLSAGGGRLAWVPSARVTETVPEGRMSAGWLTRRWYRTGLVEAKALMAARSPASGRAIAVGKGIVRLAAGVGRLTAAVVASGGQAARVVASLYTLCRGAGYVAGALGATSLEYRPPVRPVRSIGARP